MHYLGIQITVNLVSLVASSVQDSTQAPYISDCTDINLHDIDNRIALALKYPEQHAASGLQIIKDIFEYYQYLSEMTESIDKENNYKLLRVILSHPPHFIAVHYDDDRLLKAFSWTNDQLEEFNRAFEGSFLLWQRLESMRGKFN